VKTVFLVALVVSLVALFVWSSVVSEQLVGEIADTYIPSRELVAYTESSVCGISNEEPPSEALRSKNQTPQELVDQIAADGWTGIIVRLATSTAMKQFLADHFIPGKYSTASLYLNEGGGFFTVIVHRCDLEELAGDARVVRIAQISNYQVSY
jgi:hypothetical protein